MEYIRDLSIKIEIDTNKQTISEEFSSLADFYDWISENDFSTIEDSD